MRIDLGGADVGMAQHGLHAAQVGATFEQMGGEGVPQNMGAESAKNSDRFSARAQQFPERLPRHASATSSDEQVRAGAALKQDRPLFDPIALDRA